MRKKESLNQNWIIKTFRLKPEVIFLYNFLEFYTMYIHNMSRDELFDTIIKDSLKYIVSNNLSIVRTKEKSKRIVKGFSIKENTMDALNALFKAHEHMYKAEIVEFLIILYLKNNVKKKDAEPFITFYNSVLSD